MLRWAAIFFLIALAAGILGFTTIAGSAMAIAQILFFFFLGGALLLLIIALVFVTRIKR